MRKVAIFVEGYTEEAFVQRMVVELVGQENVQIEVQRQHSGILQTVAIHSISGAEEKFVLLVNCCSDGAVLTQIRDQYPFLESAGYDCIFGLRDVFPEPPASVPSLIRDVKALLPNGRIPVTMFFAIREVEAWFVQEGTHYPRIDAALTPAVVASAGFDPYAANANSELIVAPAQHLHSIYQIAGKAYRKKRTQLARTVTALSAEEVYFNVRLNLASLNEFLSGLEDGLFPA